ncbi:MAG: GNAT family N-acetyltransferase [Proteobacteria bacterium]|nr:GNAT family N-acetyltransferase [Pseudomonadota bacterium]
MFADYASDPTLYEECLTLLDSCFPGIKTIADKGRTHNAYWDKASIPFIVRQNQQLIAHLGILPFHFIIQGKHYKAAALHGICTKVEFRRKGYFRQLMNEAMQYTSEHYDFSFLFTDQPYLYEPFGFKVVAEYDFIYDFSFKKDQNLTLRKLDLDNPNDLEIMQSLYLKRQPISNCFGIINEVTVATLNAMHDPVFYIEALNALIIYQIKHEVLYVKDIVCEKSLELNIVLSAISQKFSKVVLQFSPDSFLSPPFKAIKATPECCIMISKDFEMKCPTFRYIESQRC